MNSEGGFGGVKGFDPVFISLGCGPGMELGQDGGLVVCLVWIWFILRVRMVLVLKSPRTIFVTSDFLKDLTCQFSKHLKRTKPAIK